MSTNRPGVIRNYKIPVRLILAALEKYGVTGDTFRDMLVRSAKVTHEKGNRRFHDWFFTLDPDNNVISFCKGEDGELVHVSSIPAPIYKPQQGLPALDRGEDASNDTMPLQSLLRSSEPIIQIPPDDDEAHLYTCEHCKDTKVVSVADVCGWCDGEGCSRCGGKGEAVREIPCQYCASSDPFEFVKRLFHKKKAI